MKTSKNVEYNFKNERHLVDWGCAWKEPLPWKQDFGTTGQS